MRTSQRTAERRSRALQKAREMVSVDQEALMLMPLGYWCEKMMDTSIGRFFYRLNVLKFERVGGRSRTNAKAALAHTPGVFSSWAEREELLEVTGVLQEFSIDERQSQLW